MTICFHEDITGNRLTHPGGVLFAYPSAERCMSRLDVMGMGDLCTAARVG